MKRIMRLYESCSTGIRVACFGFVLISLGFLIQNESVNIFYTIRNSFILFIGEFSLRTGELIILNLPLIFMVNMVCKKANSGMPIMLALVGYFSFIVTTMMFSPQSIEGAAYLGGTSINSIFKDLPLNKLPIETGFIGSILVAFATRFSFTQSRHRSSYSILNLFDKDTAALLTNIFICFVLGLLASYIFPIFYSYLGILTKYIAQNLMDPIRIGLYGFLERSLSIIGLGDAISTPFWYTSIGGSFTSAITGETVFGDVNIWNYLGELNASYAGAGRFITPYYIINIFLVPGILAGMLISMSDNKERLKSLVPIVGLSILSIVAGNPLPLELYLLLTAPLLLVTYLLIVALIFGLLSYLNLFLGFSCHSVSTITAMPGSFPDFIINIRNAVYGKTIMNVALLGIVFFVVGIIITYLYYHYFSYDLFATGNKEKLAKQIAIAVGGEENVSSVGTGNLHLNIYLNDLEKISYDELRSLGASHILETRDSISIEFGSISEVLAIALRNRVKKKTAIKS